MPDIYKNNLSARAIINSKVRQANAKKYNFSLNQEAEEMSGEPNDREAYDVGIEPENY